VTSSQAGVAAFASRHSDSQEVDVVLINETANQSATVHLNLGLAGSRTATQYQIAPGSSTIAKSQIANSSQPITLPPYSVTLVQVVPR
jgi:hypothetical protein